MIYNSADCALSSCCSQDYWISTATVVGTITWGTIIVKTFSGLNVLCIFSNAVFVGSLIDLVNTHQKHCWLTERSNGFSWGAVLFHCTISSFPWICSTIDCFSTHPSGIIITVSCGLSYTSTGISVCWIIMRMKIGKNICLSFVLYISGSKKQIIILIHDHLSIEQLHCIKQHYSIVTFITLRKKLKIRFSIFAITTYITTVLISLFLIPIVD